MFKEKEKKAEDILNKNLLNSAHNDKTSPKVNDLAIKDKPAFHSLTADQPKYPQVQEKNKKEEGFSAQSGVKVSIDPVNADFGKPGINRIPPRVDTEVNVKVSGVPSSFPGVVFKVYNTDGISDATLTINGQSYFYAKNDTTLKLKGDK